LKNKHKSEGSDSFSIEVKIRPGSTNNI